jgi:hypothetical protein
MFTNTSNFPSHVDESTTVDFVVHFIEAGVVFECSVDVVLIDGFNTKLNDVALSYDAVSQVEYFLTDTLLYGGGAPVHSLLLAQPKFGIVIAQRQPLQLQQPGAGALTIAAALRFCNDQSVESSRSDYQSVPLDSSSSIQLLLLDPPTGQPQTQHSIELNSTLWISGDGKCFELDALASIPAAPSIIFKRIVLLIDIVNAAWTEIANTDFTWRTSGGTKLIVSTASTGAHDSKQRLLASPEALAYF